MLKNLKKARAFASVSKEILSYVGQSSLVPKKTSNIWKQREERAKLIQKYSRRVLKSMDIEVEVNDEFDYLLKDNALIVCNHMSYLDILVLSSIYPSCFITSMEMKKTPVLGQLCDLGGCVYVERRNKNKLGEEIKEITQALNRGLNVCFFPEATSHNGEELLRFRKPLFNAARYAHKKVLPICLNYEELDGEGFHVDNRDLVCWYGDMGFLPHMWNLCGAKKVKVSLKFLEPISNPQNFHSRDLAAKTQEMVREHFKPAQTNP